MSQQRFNAIWEPRVGREATNLIRKRSWFALGQLAALAVIVVLAITLNGSLYYFVGLPVIAAYVIVYIVLLRRSNGRLAAALSHHLGVAIPPGNLPPVRSVQRFDKAVADLREGRPRRKKALLGGFIRVELPPKP